MKKFFLFLMFIPLFVLVSCGSESKNSNNQTTENKPKEIQWSEATKISDDNFSEFLTISLSVSSKKITVRSKKKNSYEKFEDSWVRIYLVVLSLGKYWNNLGVIYLNSDGYGTFTSDDLSLLCNYYGSELEVWPEMCYWSGKYYNGTPVD